ncbi:MAG: hypothetical protein D6813_07110 [Calditrichaeota bacterium]|nr:MAG: hypothetical protein D6813_07110 [Calditrichota bacterium]
MKKEKLLDNGLIKLFKDFLQEPMPKGVSWPHTLGSALIALITVQIVTGILLAFYYSPNANAAWESVRYIETRVIFGKIIRGIHYFAASGMVILIFLHMMRTFFYGAYKRPRQLTWVFGVFLLLLVLGFAFTGYLLPWDMKAYFATKVGINIAGVVPVVGKYLIKILQGGPEMSSITLSRFFTIHVIILPISLLALVGLHIFYIRYYGPTPPWLKEGDPVTYNGRFYPGQLFRDSLVAFLVIAIIVTLAVNFGAPLDPKANPNDTSFIPRPDWYFYSLFQLLKIFEGKLEIIGAVILPGAFFTLLILLPFLDRNPERRLSKRPVAVTLGGLTVFLIILLTAWGAYEGEKAKKAMVKTKEAELTETKKEAVDITQGDAGEGAILFAELKCGVCHWSTSQDVNIPPGLEYSGNKYQPDWLLDFLLQPYRIRWEKKNVRPVIRMPNFGLTRQEALNIAAYLMNMRRDDLFTSPNFDWSEADEDFVTSGKSLIEEYGCLGCHKIGDEGQNIGPELTHVGSKLTETYMFHLIKNPNELIPGTPMKNFKLSDEEVIDLVAYLRTLK